MLFNRLLSSLSLPEQSLVALTHAGFETVHDLRDISAEQLSKDTNLTTAVCDAILVAAQAPAPFGPSLTQSASSMLVGSTKNFTLSAPVDALLGGGLSPGRIVDLSGPPSSPKEKFVLACVRSAVEMGDGVLFVDSQNMITPAMLTSELTNIPEALELVQYVKCHTLAELVSFFLDLSLYLDSHPKISLLVLNSFSYPFQHGSSNFSSRTVAYERIREFLSMACATRNLTVVITNHMSTKFLDADGSLANFDAGRQAIVVPQLGTQHLPPSRSYRVVLIPNSPTTGVIRLLSSPSSPHGKKPFSEEPYSTSSPVHNNAR